MSDLSSQTEAVSEQGYKTLDEVGELIDSARKCHALVESAVGYIDAESKAEAIPQLCEARQALSEPKWPDTLISMISQLESEARALPDKEEADDEG